MPQVVLLIKIIVKMKMVQVKKYRSEKCGTHHSRKPLVAIEPKEMK
jgi:hypothetical protein